MTSASKPQSVRFWTDDGFEVVLADDYDALVEQLEVAKQAREDCVTEGIRLLEQLETLRADYDQQVRLVMQLGEQLEAWDEAFREILDVTEKWTRPLTDEERLLRIDTLAKAALARVPNPAKRST